MPLPDVIEIIPLERPVPAEITVPGSKSITNRALILAALNRGETTLHGALWSEDTQVMVDCLNHLGLAISIAPAPDELGNRVIQVRGSGGRIRAGGTPDRPLDLFVGNAGTAARFLAALVSLGHGVYRLHGVPRMHERPQAALFSAMRQLGCRIDSPNDKLPALIYGKGPRPGKCLVSIEESSQFASALLLCAKAGGWKIEVRGENAEESPYVAMTSKLIKAFPKRGGVFHIEPDASSGSYFWAAGWLNPVRRWKPEGKKRTEPSPDGGTVSTRQFVMQEMPSCIVRQWPKSDWQIDSQFPHFLPLPPSLSRQSQLGDSIMTAIILAPFAPKPVRFTDLGRLRLQECERVEALHTELSKCGAELFEEGDALHVFPSRLHRATIETYNDHRMAMCFAVLGLKVPGIRIKNPACVKKTFPNFFQKLAAPAPQGLGATILEAATQRPLRLAELFAE
jgi:3-phosphoshikimate 1-carboxyvinyltransferase